MGKILHSKNLEHEPEDGTENANVFSGNSLIPDIRETV